MRASHANLVLSCSGVLAAAGGVLASWMIVPQFFDLFAAFEAELPLLTWLFVESDGTLWGLPVLTPALAVLVRKRDPKDARRGLLALSLGLAVGVVLPLLCVLAMYLPIFKLAAVVG